VAVDLYKDVYTIERDDGQDSLYWRVRLHWHHLKLHGLHMVLIYHTGGPTISFEMRDHWIWRLWATLNRVTTNEDTLARIIVSRLARAEKRLQRGHHPTAPSEEVVTT